MNNELIIQNLQSLKSTTEAGKIIWQTVNPNTFLWVAQDSQGEPNNVVLQKISKVEQNRKFEVIVFRIFNPKLKLTILELSTDLVEEVLKNSIYDLFNFVKDRIEQTKIDFLKNLIDNVK